MPGIKDRLDRAVELFPNVLWKVALEPVADDRFETVDEILPGCRVDLGIGCDAQLLLGLVDQLFKAIFRDAQHDVREHRDKAAIGIPGKAIVCRELGERVDGAVVEPEIEDRVHHAGHRDARAAAHGNQQRVFDRAEAFAGAFFELAHRGVDLLVQAVGEDAAGIVKLQARFGGDRKAGRHGQTGGGHLG